MTLFDKITLIIAITGIIILIIYYFINNIIIKFLQKQKSKINRFNNIQKEMNNMELEKKSKLSNALREEQNYNLTKKYLTTEELKILIHKIHLLESELDFYLTRELKDKNHD